MPRRKNEARKESSQKEASETKAPRKTSKRKIEANRENSPMSRGMKDIPADYNKRLVLFTAAIMPQEKVDKRDVAKMRERFNRYLELCAEYGMKVGNLAAYSAMGITKQDADDFTRRTSPELQERAEFIRQVKMYCSTYREGLMSDQKVHPATGIFWQKNYDGLVDQHVELKANVDVLGEKQDVARLEKKYSESAKLIEEKQRIENPRMQNAVMDAEYSEHKDD